MSDLFAPSSLLSLALALLVGTVPIAQLLLPKLVEYRKVCRATDAVNVK